MNITEYFLSLATKIKEQFPDFEVGNYGRLCEGKMKLPRISIEIENAEDFEDNGDDQLDSNLNFVVFVFISELQENAELIAFQMAMTLAAELAKFKRPNSDFSNISIKEIEEENLKPRFNSVTAMAIRCTVSPTIGDSWHASLPPFIPADVEPSNIEVQF